MRRERGTETEMYIERGREKDTKSHREILRRKEKTEGERRAFG